MKLTQCPKGHFYDAEKYSACPHCSGMGDNNVFASGVADQTTEALLASSYSGDRARSGMPYPADGGGDSNPTVGYSEQVMPMPAANPTNQPSPGDGGETYPYMVWHPQEQQKRENETTGQGGAGRQARPVVGWLVCIEGSHYGACFNLYGGKNFIGRSADMDVPLTGDNTVSRVKHAIIIYEPKMRKFFAQPGESHELFYLNGSVVLQSVEIQDRDVITIGKTSLVFVPFCDERYGWEK